ncbi:GIY-YIG nuclease family protein [Salinibacter altiplanensis]|uniref:GIY-YIG nuclease family protein n=1 Tax=Salinibacter altiplanensis TaxID=1803181 RepID=UPI000C9F926C|nr:GIY-YIG nuclease family protein [Salinibacter altiplanensis]
MNCNYRVYLIENLKTGGSYVGMTSKCVEERFRQHVGDARRGTGCYLHKAINKYGPECFEIFPLEGAKTRQVAHQLEKDWIRKIGTYEDRNGYNMTPGGEGQPPGEDHPLYGTTFEVTEEHRRKLSQAQTNRDYELDRETRLKIAESQSHLDRGQAAKAKYVAQETDLTSRQIAKIYGASRHCIGFIKEGRTWKKVQPQRPNDFLEIVEEYGNAPHGNSTLSNQEAAEIKYLARNTDMTNGEIATIYGVSRGNVSVIKRGDTWKGIEPRRPNKFSQLSLF